MDLTRDDVEFKAGPTGATTRRPHERRHDRRASAALAARAASRSCASSARSGRSSRSVRSTRWSLFAALLFTIGIAALACAVVAHHYPQMSPRTSADFHPLEVNLAGVQLAQLAIGVLGVLVITAEYSTGMIRASFTAVPKRLPVLWGKAIVYGLVTLALMMPVGPDRVLRRRGDPSPATTSTSPFSHPGVARAVFGAALYLTVVGLFGLGLGAIVRNTAGGIASFAAIMFVLPPLMNVLPTSWNNAASPYLPLAGGRGDPLDDPGQPSVAVGRAWRSSPAMPPWPSRVAAVLLVRRDT